MKSKPSLAVIEDLSLRLHVQRVQEPALSRGHVCHSTLLLDRESVQLNKQPSFILCHMHTTRFTIAIAVA